MIENERTLRHELVIDAARRMMTAARTAPKGKGVDILEIALVTGGDIQCLAEEMRNVSAGTGIQKSFFQS